MWNMLSAWMKAMLGKALSKPGEEFPRFYTIHKNKSRFTILKLKQSFSQRPLGMLKVTSDGTKAPGSWGSTWAREAVPGCSTLGHAASLPPRSLRVLTPSAPVGICPLTFSVRKGEWVDKRLSHSLGRGSGTDSMKFFFNSLMLAWCFFISSWVLSRS